MDDSRPLLLLFFDKVFSLLGDSLIFVLGPHQLRLHLDHLVLHSDTNVSESKHFRFEGFVFLEIQSLDMGRILVLVVKLYLNLLFEYLVFQLSVFYLQVLNDLKQ